MSTIKEEVWEMALDSCDLQHERHREIVFETLPNNEKVWSSLVFEDTKGGVKTDKNGKPIKSYYKVPLGLVTPQVHGTGSIKANVMVPLLPMVYTTPNHDKFEAIPVRKGWIYLFKNEYLWRELEVVERSYLKDINLNEHQGMDERRAYGERDKRVVVPHMVDSKKQKIEICYSEVQWSWDYINTMGGMDPVDPRLKPDTKNPTGKQKNNAAARRKNRMQELNNLGDYIHGFSASPNDADIGKLSGKQRVHKRLHAPSQLGAVYLHDPIGIAKLLKEQNITDVYYMEVMSECMAQADYPLAKAIKSLIEAEERGLLNDPEFKQEVNDTALVKVAESGRYAQLTQYQQKELIDEHVKTYNEVAGKKRKLANATRINLLDTRLQYWEKIDKETNKATDKSGMVVLNYIKDSSLPVTVHTALLDYLENVAIRNLAGKGVWCYLNHGIDCKEGADYIEGVLGDKYEISKIMLEKPSKTIQKYAELYEKGNKDVLIMQAEKEGLSAKEVLSAAKSATGIVSQLLITYSKAKLKENKRGLQWLSDFINDYMPEIEASVASKTIGFLYQPELVMEKHLYRYLPSDTDLINKQKIDHIQLKGIPLHRSIKAMQESQTFKLFSVLVSVVEQINYGQVIKTAWFNENATGKDRFEFFSASVKLSDFVASTLEVAFELQEKNWKAIDSEKFKKELVNKGKKGISRWDKKTGTLDSSLRQQRTLARHAQRAAEHHAKNLQRYTHLASRAASITGFISATMGFTVGGIDFYEQVRSGGSRGLVGSGMVLSSQMMQMLTAVKTVKWMVTAARGGMVVGAGTSEVGVGIIIFLASFVLEAVGQKLLEKVSFTKLESAILYGFFGNDSYASILTKWRTSFEEHVREFVPKSGVPMQPPVYIHDVSAEIKEIYRALYSFEAYTDLAYAKENADYKSHVVRGIINFTNILPGQSVVDVNMKVRFLTSELQIDHDELLTLPQLKLLEIKKDGALVGLKYFWPIDGKAASFIGSIVMTVRMDINGDGQYMVPETEPMERMFVINRRYNDGKPPILGGSPHRYYGGPKTSELHYNLPDQAYSEVLQAK